MTKRGDLYKLNDHLYMVIRAWYRSPALFMNLSDAQDASIDNKGNGIVVNIDEYISSNERRLSDRRELVHTVNEIRGALAGMHVDLLANKTSLLGNIDDVHNQTIQITELTERLDNLEKLIRVHRDKSSTMDIDPLVLNIRSRKRRSIGDT